MQAAAAFCLVMHIKLLFSKVRFKVVVRLVGVVLQSGIAFVNYHSKYLY